MSKSSWHVVRWPPLAWARRSSSSLHLAPLEWPCHSHATESQAMDPVSTAQLATLVTLSLGLLAVIWDRWIEREIIEVAFVMLSNIAHWGLLAAFFVSPIDHSRWLLSAALMLVEDLVKLAFLRVHRFTLRGASTRAMIGLSSVFAVGYAAIIGLEVLAR